MGNLCSCWICWAFFLRNSAWFLAYCSLTEVAGFLGTSEASAGSLGSSVGCAGPAGTLVPGGCAGVGAADWGFANSFGNLYFSFRPRPGVRVRTNDQMAFALIFRPYFS